MDAADTNGHGELTVRAYLADWLEIQRHRLQPTTLKAYRGNVRRYLEPHIGDVKLADLGIRQLEGLYADLMSGGGQDGRPLARRTVEYAAATLRSALNDAVRTGLLASNPAGLARLPRIDPTSTTEDDEQLQVWTAEEVRSFLEQIEGDRLYDLWVVALGTGMRRGELLGLRWEDVDLDGGTMRVCRSLQVVDGVARLKRTKTSRSRSLRVDRRVVEVLDRRRRLQEIHREAAGERWANDWGLVFTEEDGSHLVPINVTASFRWLVRKLDDVPVIRMHDLRHTHATLLLQAGIPIKVVSERLGHTTIRVTLDVYAHVLPAMDEVAVERFEEHVYGQR